MSTVIELTRPRPHVAHVWLNRPDVRNAFNDEVITTLSDTFAALSKDPDLRVVVLGAHGKAFCAGADLNWMKTMAGFNWDQNRADAQRLADMLKLLDDCPVPVVGRIQGDCYAGGMGLASICDVVVAAEAVNFCLSEARLGLLPATISPYVIRAMGARAAHRYFLTAERFAAQEAHRIGFVHELVGAGALEGRVAELAQALASASPHAVKACKRLVQEVADRAIDAALVAATVEGIADIRASEEGREGVASFLQKRKPSWLA